MCKWKWRKWNVSAKKKASEHIPTNPHSVWLIEFLLLLLILFYSLFDRENRKWRSQQRKSNIKYKGVAFYFGTTTIASLSNCSNFKLIVNINKSIVNRTSFFFAYCFIWCMRSERYSPSVFLALSHTLQITKEKNNAIQLSISSKIHWIESKCVRNFLEQGNYSWTFSVLW